MKLLIATSNKGKVREFTEMLSAPGVDISFCDLSAFDPIEPVEETGESFRENASLKASYYAKATGMWALADDSGLTVNALNSNPGIHSARWAARHNAGSGDAANNTLLLQQLEDVPDQGREAQFVCFLALANPEGEIVAGVLDSVSGTILRHPRGDNGFGYDPLFWVAELGKSMAELTSAEKHAISHRGKALARFREVLTRIVYNGAGATAESPSPEKPASKKRR